MRRLSTTVIASVAVLATLVVCFAMMACSVTVSEQEGEAHPIEDARSFEEAPGADPEEAILVSEAGRTSSEQPGAQEGTSEDEGIVSVAHADNAEDATVQTAAAQEPWRPSPPSPGASSHMHDWRPITEPREVVDVPAWDEVRYKTVERTICSVCGEDITSGDSQGRTILAHGKAHALAGEGGGTYSTVKQVPDGVIKHPAQTHIESATVGWKCAGCEQRKTA